MTNGNRVIDFYQTIVNELSKIIIGKEQIKELLVIALIVEGHVLIEGMPGSGKTKLARSFAEAIGGEFERIQFTPDMIPADVTGYYFYSRDGTSRFVPGPVFANVVLADELNRTTPRTQSALLEAMQELQVTIEGKTHPITKPFILVGTQVQPGAEGTYPLTEVQIDRFLARVFSGYSSKEEEKFIIGNIDRIDSPEIKAVTNTQEIKEMQEIVKQVHVSPDILEYITSIVDTLRIDPDVLLAPSSRGSISVYKCARAVALLDGRDFVIPDDVKRHIAFLLEHRLRVKPEAELDGITPSMILQKALDSVPVPKLKV